MDITKLSAANPKKLIPLSIILLLLILLSSLYWQITGLKKQALDIATTKAQGTAILIKAARAWNSQLGGVYGPVSAILQPNPYLIVPDRDIRSNMGHKLTKINPAYMTRQIFDIIREPEHLVMRITSLKPLNPVNAPDDWEIKALTRAETTRTDTIELVRSGTGESYRYMALLIVEESCMKCHAQQGYKLGDIRGGISVIQPSAHINELIMPQMRKVILMHMLAFILSSIVVITLLSRMNRQWADLNLLAENQQKAILNSTLKLRETNESLQAEIENRKAAESSLKNTNMQMGKWIGALQDRSRQMILMNQMGGMLHSCSSVDDAFKVAASFIKQMPVFGSGSIYAYDKAQKYYKIAASWGKNVCKDILWPEECWGIKLGRIHRYETGPDAIACPHFLENCCGICVCMPLAAAGETVGLISFVTERFEKFGEDDFQNQATFLVAEHIGLSLTNILLREKLRSESIKDPLTNLYNRRYLDEALLKEIYRAARSGGSFCLIMGDIDHFKNLNDKYGHEAGDIVLKGLADLMTSCIRAEDTACRYGGEEFVILLASCDLTVALQKAEQMRKTFKDITFRSAKDEEIKVTISFGIAQYPTHGNTLEKMQQAADAALYSAKSLGRDRTEIASISS